MRAARSVLPLLLLGLGCRTIQIDEPDVFPAKRLVSARLLSQLGAERRELRIPVEEGVELAAWHITRPEARATVLAFGGNGSLMATSTELVRALLSLPVNVLLADYRGYGESDGRPTVAALKADARKVLDHLTGPLGVPVEKVVLHGHSLGSFAALQLANELSVGAVVLEAPVSNLRELTRGMVPWLVRPLVSFEIAPVLLAEDNVSRMASLDEPLLIVVGAEDQITPRSMAQSLLERVPGSIDARLVVVPGASHDDLPEHAAFVEAYRELLLRHGLLPPSAAP
jgi:pimeloyl-ACP methyl ester carboxylesterase